MRMPFALFFFASICVCGYGENGTKHDAKIIMGGEEVGLYIVEKGEEKVSHFFLFTHPGSSVILQVVKVGEFFMALGCQSPSELDMQVNLDYSEEDNIQRIYFMKNKKVVGCFRIDKKNGSLVKEKDKEILGFEAGPENRARG